MRSPRIVITVEAGDWPPPAELRKLARRAVKAAAAAIGDRRDPLSPAGSDGKFPSPDASGIDHSASGPGTAPELSVVFTNDASIQRLNAEWRGKDAPSNVLSFPQRRPGKSGRLLGDVVLAAETVRREAALAEKPLEDHMAHLLIHGYLHLLGFDHQVEVDAEKMEQLERVALKSLGLDDPYATAFRQ
jgi:probable rRNA maturation factor